MTIDPVWFVIPGRLRGKGRPRARVMGKFAHIHSDPKTVNAEAMVREFAAKAMAGRSLLEGAVKLSVTIWLQRPKSWSAKKWIENPIPTGKPDLDNVVKLVGDACNGILWSDDSQIADLRICRMFCPPSVPERTEIMAGQITNVQEIAA
jgi:Holliday junction resolvase RusA-like endonuclease